jgi:Holliday junction resolvase RusA-like endonuclease
VKKFEFTVIGEPKGKARPRFVRMGNAVRTYTPKTTKSYEDQIAKEFTTQGGTIFDYPYLEVKIAAYFSIPKSARKADRLKMEAGGCWYNKKPDCDNVAKAVLDALNEVAWHDDKQIVYLKVKKYYGKEPHIDIEIWEVE